MGHRKNDFAIAASQNLATIALRVEFWMTQKDKGEEKKEAWMKDKSVTQACHPHKGKVHRNTGT
jgi:hypothetical protein